MSKLLSEEEDEVTRCRRVRDEMDARFGTLDKAFARLEELARLRKRRGVKTARARAHGKARFAARNGKPANERHVHKV